MKKVILIRYGEIYLKGNNRYYFESMLVRNIKKAITGRMLKIDNIVWLIFGKNLSVKKNILFPNTRTVSVANTIAAKITVYIIV